MLHCTDSGNFGRMLVNDAHTGHQIAEDIVHRMNRLGWPERDVFAVHLALSEGISNAIEHGNKSDPTKFVMVEATVEKKVVRVRIVDEGTGFNPEHLPDCTDSSHVSVPHGRGVHLMRKLMDSVTFHDRGNDVRMEKRRAK